MKVVPQLKIYNPEDDANYKKAYNALTKIKDDYTNYNIAMKIYLTPRSDFGGTAEERRPQGCGDHSPGTALPAARPPVGGII